MGMIKFCGNKLNALMADKKVKQSQVSKVLGVGRNTVSRWINGSRVPEVGTIVKILEVLGYSDSEAKEVFWTLYN